MAPLIYAGCALVIGAAFVLAPAVAARETAFVSGSPAGRRLKVFLCLAAPAFILIR